MSDTTNLDELYDLACRLVAVLDDPHPGLITWHIAVAQLVHKIAAYTEVEA